jgi:hypothetical protein
MLPNDVKQISTFDVADLTLAWFSFHHADALSEFFLKHLASLCLFIPQKLHLLLEPPLLVLPPLLPLSFLPLCFGQQLFHITGGVTKPLQFLKSMGSCHFFIANTLY